MADDHAVIRCARALRVLFCGSVTVVASCGGSGASGPTGVGESIREDQEARDGPVYLAGGGESQWYFGTVAEMAATSDVIVRGRVEAVGPGRAVGDVAAGDDGQAGHLRVRDATLSVDEVLKGDVQAGDAIVLEEYGYDRAGTAFAIEDQPWSLVGDEGYFFLYRESNWPSQHFALVGADGRLLVVNGDVVSFADTPLGVDLDALSSQQLVSELEREIDMARSSRLRPQRPMAVVDREYVERVSYERERVTEPTYTESPSVSSPPSSVGSTPTGDGD